MIFKFLLLLLGLQFVFFYINLWADSLLRLGFLEMELLELAVRTYLWLWKPNSKMAFRKAMPIPFTPAGQSPPMSLPPQTYVWIRKFLYTSILISEILLFP